MCRLLAITATDVPNNLVADLTHWVMTTNSEDNTHGHGVSFVDNQGKMILFKSMKSYPNGDFAWVRPYIANGVGPLIAHVRNASPGTEVSNRTAHPFGWELSDGSPFVGIHNGYFSGMSQHATVDEPKSDTYVAFKLLSDVLDMLDPSEELAYRHIKAWAGRVCTYSAYAAMFWFRNRLYVFRNNARTLYATPFGNGLLITTAKPVIEAVVKYAYERYGKYVKQDQPIVMMPEHTLYAITPGNGNMVSVEQFEDFEAPTDNRGGVYGRQTSTNFREQSAWGSDYDDYHSVRASSESTTGSATQPLILPTGSTNSQKEEKAAAEVEIHVTPSRADSIREKGKIWSIIRSMLNPAREKFCLIMLRSFLKIKPGEPCVWTDISIAELRRFHDFIERQSITSEIRRWINRWNNYVEKDNEYATYVEYFGEYFMAGAMPFFDDGFNLASMWTVLDDVLEEKASKAGVW